MEAIHGLIQELADYEKAGDEVAITPSDLIRDGFSERKAFETLVADLEGQVVGFVLYFPYYSTWKGACIKLEDFVVKSKYRRQGIGLLLFDALLAEVKRKGAKRLDWQVLDWNEPAIAFYKKIGASLNREWIDCRLSF